jgi:hypothetical protein
MTSGAQETLAVVQSARQQLEALSRYDHAMAACAAAMARMEEVLARPPRVVILGEVNAGKTSIADLLLGVGLLPSSVVANTRLPVLIRYEETTALYAVAGNKRLLLTNADLDALPTGVHMDGLEIGLPSERLSEFEILDTPALSDSQSDAGIADGDIRIWCTVATRAWTESERAFWSGQPHRNWHNALLVATHKDALEHPSDATKVEWRLRAAAGDMFRDIILVSATDAAKTRRTNGRATDVSAIALLGQVRVWASEIRERRAQKVERIVRRLARLTFHQLARGAALKPVEAKILATWEADCARSVARMGSAPDDLAHVLQELLRSFARAMEQTRPGSIARSHRSPKMHDAAPRVPQPGAPARRYARLVAADLTTLLRIELARSGLRDATLFADYAAARSALLPLTRLDLEMAQLQAILALADDDEVLIGAVAPERALPALAGTR